MNGYSKIKRGNSKKSKQPQDFSDLPSPKHVSKTIPKPISKFQIAKETKPENGLRDTHSFGSEVEDVEKGKGERFGGVLSRTCSVSSSSRRYKIENNGKSGLQSAVKRAFSMARSSSVSERYGRIQDQGMTTSSYDYDEEYNKNGDFIVKKKNGGKLFKACKSLFRF